MIPFFSDLPFGSPLSNPFWVCMQSRPGLPCQPERERERACQPVGGEREREGKRKEAKKRVRVASNLCHKCQEERLGVYYNILRYIYILLVTPKDGTLKTILATYKTSIWGMHYVRHGKGCSLSSLFRVGR